MIILFFFARFSLVLRTGSGVGSRLPAITGIEPLGKPEEDNPLLN